MATKQYHVQGLVRFNYGKRPATNARFLLSTSKNEAVAKFHKFISDLYVSGIESVEVYPVTVAS